MFRGRIVFYLTLCILLKSSTADEKVEKSDRDRTESKRSFARDCAHSYSLTCLKLDIVSWVDKLNENDDFAVLPGVSVIRENGSASANTGEIVAELAREFPDDPDARLDAFILKKISGYLTSHSLKLNLWDKNQPEEARGKGGGGGGGGGGGKKGGGGMEYLLAAGAMMKGTLMAIALKGLALIAGKALMTALISLLLSAIIGLKSLTHQEKHTTYEVVSKPVYSSSHTHSVAHEDHGGHYGHSSYGRSFDVPLPLGLHPEYKPA